VMTASKTARPRGDRVLWQEAVRDVEPMRSRGLPAGTSSDQRPNPNAARIDRSRVSPSPASPPLDRFAGIDRANAERLKRGLREIEATLDLHGMTQAEAHRALAAFVAASHDAGRRCVLVITGRGLGSSGPGILKRSVPRWLEEPELRRRILAVAPAQPRHGGPGATYVLLRRPR